MLRERLKTPPENKNGEEEVFRKGTERVRMKTFVHVHTVHLYVGAVQRPKLGIKCQLLFRPLMEREERPLFR